MPHEIKHILFDCDNTLVLSEDLAFEACADLTNEILAANGVSDRYTGEQLIADFVGQNFRGMMSAIQAKYGFKMTLEDVERYVKEEENAVIAKLVAKAQPCTGATEVLEKLHAEKRYGLAVVSSSALRRVRASIEKVDQAKFFPHDRVYSAATSLAKPTTKPDPAIYVHALKEIGVNPNECVAVEDSKSGATAAVRANIPCIAYVGAYSTVEKQNQVAKTLTTVGCKAVMYNFSEFFDCLKKIEALD